MILVLLVHLFVAALAGALGTRMGRRVLLLGAVAPLSATVWAFSVTADTLNGTVLTESVQWVAALGLDLGFRLTSFGLVMVLILGVIGVLVFAYGWQYFSDPRGLGRFTALLVLFAGSMFGLFTADNLLVLFTFWELTSITSYLLIGFNDTSAPARASALQALLVTGTGGLVMLAGLVLLAQSADSYSLATILSSSPTGAAVEVALALILVGAFTKSAQWPFHFWLPGAMAAPTPVSAFLHSATMVKAGVFVVALLAPVFAPTVLWWRPVILAVGLTTMIVGGWRAMAQHDLKLLLAHGTVSQLGFFTVLVGVGIPEVTFAGVAMILAHAVFKAALFMVAGIVDHQARTRDTRRLTGVGRQMPATFAIAVVATASMAGFPPLLGYVTKESAFEALIHGTPVWVVGLIAAGSVLTVAYGLRFVRDGFATKTADELAEDPAGPDAKPPTPWFLAPPLLLGALTLAFGLAPALVDGLVGEGAAALDPEAAGNHLAVWHGFGAPLALSALVLATGVLLWRRPLPRLRALTSKLPTAVSAYNASVSGLNLAAGRSTGLLQNGSLPAYLGVIMATTILAPGVVMLRYWSPPPAVFFAESPVQVAIALLVVGGAVAVAGVKHRLAAVILLGAVGYGVAGLFVIQGAPDLALTQLLVETLTLALFVLVLSYLPEHFETVRWRLRQVTRVTVSVGMGLMAGAFALWAGGARVAPPLVDEFMTRAEPEAGGRNVVNVILTGFRALDTLGEITVLVVAALGVITLIRARIEQSEGQG